MAELTEKFVHKGWSFKVGINPGKPGGRIATRWSCPPDCGACKEDKKLAKRYPWIF